MTVCHPMLLIFTFLTLGCLTPVHPPEALSLIHNKSETLLTDWKDYYQQCSILSFVMCSGCKLLEPISDFFSP